MTAISGMLTQKIARQESASISAPAAGRAEHRRDPGPRGPGADRRPRASPSKVAATIASEPGTSSAPATPCSARAPIRNRSFGAIAQSDRGHAEARSARRRRSAGARTGRRACRRPAAARPASSSVGLDHPLLAGEAGVEVFADRRQGDVDHGRVEEDDGRAEDRRDQRQALLAGHAGRVYAAPLLDCLAQLLRGREEVAVGERGRQQRRRSRRCRAARREGSAAVAPRRSGWRRRAASRPSSRGRRSARWSWSSRPA